jgi:Cysteine-rich CPXCG
MFTTDEDIVWTCQYCGTQNSVWVDLTTSNKYDFFEDCEICCRPNRIIITIDNDENIFLDARPSDE